MSQVRATYPAPFEAILRAKKAIFDAELKTFWALQRACVVLAIHAYTLPFCWRF